MIAKVTPRQQEERFERPLRLRMRADLSIRRQCYQGTVSWVVKDPLALRYYRFREGEYAVLRWLDGTRSLEQIKREYEQQFLPQRIDLHELSQFVASLHQSGLVIAEAPGQGGQLLKRRNQRTTKQRWAKLANLLAIRFHGVDPTRMLSLLLPLARWMFHPLAAIGCLALILAAAVLITVEFHVFHSRLPAFHQFFSLGNSLWLVAAMVFAKILHELGHGLSCRYYGGECHELGLMFLVFTPCLYCNVSDSWLLPNKWHRVIIAAAGMYVELVLAATCTFLWWFSREGLFNHLCLNLMFVCSVSTLLFNANPLLRFDGYYILADLTEIPNLRSKASQVLTRGLARWCLGITSHNHPLLPGQRQWLFLLYAVAAVVYRWVITFSIIFFLLQVFEPYDLRPLGHLLILISLVSLIGVPLWRLGKYFSVPGRLEQVKRYNLLVTLAVAGLIFAVVGLVPFPHRVACELVLEPHDAEPVYVQTAGVLTDAYVKPGQHVEAGTRLARLENLDLVSQIAAQEAELQQQRLQLQNLLRQRFALSEAVATERELREVIATLEKQLAAKRHDLAALQPKAPRAGRVISPPPFHQKPPADGQLPAWSGYPFDQVNRGTFFEQGVLLCYVGPAERWEARLTIDPGDVELVAVGQHVELMLEQQPGHIYRGTIAMLAQREMELPQPQTTPDQQAPAAKKTYLATVLLNDSDGLLRAGLHGRAKIKTASQTLLTRATRWVQQTF